MNADTYNKLVSAFDDALDRYREVHDDSSNELHKALSLFEDKHFFDAAYEIRSLSLEANGCVPGILQDWAKGYK